MNSGTSIRLASALDKQLIREFIANEWSPEHVLVKSEVIFNWQYWDSFRNRPNFLLAEKNNLVVGIIGFTNYGQYLNSEEFIGFNWLSMWKVKSQASPATGLHLLFEMKKQFPSTPLATVGCNQRAKRIYEGLGFVTGSLNHFYVVGRRKTSILKGLVTIDGQDSLKYVDEVKFRNSFLGQELNEEKTIEVFRKFEVLGLEFDECKTAEFYIKRYLQCPIYSYRCHSIVDAIGEIICIIFFRIVDISQGSVIRILEIISPFNDIQIYNPVQDLLELNEADYADFYTSEPPNTKYEIFGLPLVKLDLNLPNLFEPLNLEKRVFNYAYEQGMKIKSISRGDCDQDRPFQVNPNYVT